MRLRDILVSERMPDPIRDITAFIPRTREAFTYIPSSKETQARWIQVRFNANGTLRACSKSAADFFHTLMRTAFVTMLVFALHRVPPLTQWPKLTGTAIALTGLVTSVPATTLGIIGFLIGGGGLASVRGVVSGDFFKSAGGVILAVYGCRCLGDFNNLFFFPLPFPDGMQKGIAEPYFKRVANACALPLSKLLIPAETKEMVRNHYASQEMAPQS